jgi:plasmid maintenance system antidote protein VapI
MEEPLKYSDLASKAGISTGHAHDILSGRRTPSRALAIQIWRATGYKFPPIAKLSDAEIELQAALDAKAA